MTASDHLSNIQFSIRVPDGQDKDRKYGAVYAHHGPALRLHEGKSYQDVDNVVGYLRYGMEHEFGHPDVRAQTRHNEIDEVWVHPEHRRQGIASAMLDFARSTGRVEHSTHRTDAGDAWAQAQGAAPREKKAPWNDRSGMNPA